jgi:hypothetical protein
MKLKVLLPLVIVAIFCTTTKTQAQYYFYNEDYYDDPILYEAGMSLGVMNCLTDLGGNKGLGKMGLKDLNTGKTNFAASLYFGATYKMWLGLRLEATFGKVSADDAVLEKYIDQESRNRFERNLRFRSKISEATLIMELYPTYMFRKFDTDVEPPRAAPYLMVGVGMFHFNPQGKSPTTGKWINLQPLHTEGQGFKSEQRGVDNEGNPIIFDYPADYKLTQMNVPIGIGMRYEAGPKLWLRAEILFRHLNTDYLDDASGVYANPQGFVDNMPAGATRDAAIAMSNLALNQDIPDQWGNTFGYNPGNIISRTNIRGNPLNKDAYFTFNLKVSYILGRKKFE